MTLREKGNCLIQNLIYAFLAVSVMGWFGKMQNAAAMYLLYAPLTAVLFTLTFIARRRVWRSAGMYLRVLLTFACGILWMILRLRAPQEGQAEQAALTAGSLLLLVGMTGFMALLECPVNTVAAGVIIVGISAVYWFGEKTVFVPGYLLPLLTCLGACLIPEELEGMPRLRPLVSTCLIAALLSTVIVPGEGVKSSALREAADQVVKTTIALFNLDKDELEARRPFNVGTYGWRTRVETFGGPVYPTDDGIMEVQAEEELYLRGAIRYTYNGRGWVDESNETKAGKVKRYMTSGLEGLIYSAEYKRAMDLSKCGDGFVQKTASVRMLADNDYWSVYTPSRTRKVTAAGDINLYYNNLGEVFAVRKLRADDAYTFTYYSFDGDESALRDAVIAAENEEDSAYAGVLAMNRDVPGGIDGRLYGLVSSLISGSANAYDRAAAICAYLKNNGVYTLMPPYPPEEKDFVSYFVLDDMRGYCLYYASAMTLMARMAGLPARYVEGYLCENGQDGAVTVTGRDAHAWCEVYFKGFGWVTFDATASTPENRDDGEGGGSGTEGDGQDADKPSSTPPPTPTPTPTPEPENTPNPGNWDEEGNPPKVTPTPEPDAAELDGDDGPTPTPPPATPGEPDEPDTREDGGEDGSNSGNEGNGGRWLWILLILAAFAYGVYRLVRRVKAVSPDLCARKQKTDTDTLMLWYRCILDALSSRGIRYLSGDTPGEFAVRAVEAEAADEQLIALSGEIARLRYSGKKPSAASVAQARSVYRDVLAHMNPFEKARWFLTRVKNGIGSVEQLP